MGTAAYYRSMKLQCADMSSLRSQPQPYIGSTSGDTVFVQHRWRSLRSLQQQVQVLPGSQDGELGHSCGVTLRQWTKER